MSPAEIIERLYSLGHFHNPAHLTGVAQTDLGKLQLHDAEVRIAVQSYTEFMAADFDRVSLAEHGRLGIADGEVGPATEQLIVEPRCGFPDYPYPEGVLQSQMQANWPTTCRGKLTFGRNFKQLPGLSEAQTDRVFHAVTNNWATALEDVEIFIGIYADAHIYAALKRLGGSTLAWSYLARDTCAARLEQAYDSDRSWSESLGIPTATHEVGHALGLPHNRDSSALMYPSIHSRSIQRRGYPNDTDLAQARSLGYKLSGLDQPAGDDLFRPRPWQPEPPIDPPPIPPDGQLWFSGSFVAMSDESPLGEFILVPKPKV